MTAASQQEFPRIAVQFEVHQPDGSFLLDATREDFRVTEDGKDVQVLNFQAPGPPGPSPRRSYWSSITAGAWSKRTGSRSLKQAVASFLTKLPEGSRVAVVGFSSEVERLCPFTTDRDRVRTAVNRLRPGGSTRFYDAVAEALALLDEQTGRRVVLALTDGEDTASESASLDTAIAAARRLGLPVYTLGLGTEEEIASRRSPPAGHVDPRRVLPRPQRRPAQSDLRDHRRPNRRQLHTRLRERSPSSRRHASSGANLPSRQQSSRRDRRIHPRHGRPRGRLVALVPRAAHGARGPGASSLVAEPRQACVGAGHGR